MWMMWQAGIISGVGIHGMVALLPMLAAVQTL